MIFTLVLYLILLIGTWLGYKRWNTRRKLPPGPRGWPLLGNCSLLFSENRHRDLLHTGKEYSGIFTAVLGVRLFPYKKQYIETPRQNIKLTVSLQELDTVLMEKPYKCSNEPKHKGLLCRLLSHILEEHRYSVWITSYGLFREAVIDHTWDFAGRPHELAFGDLEDGIISGGVDEDAKEIRRWTLISLRSFGFGKASMENVILHEATTLVDQMRQTGGQPFDPRQTIANASANVIASITIGRTFQPGDPGFHYIHNALTEGIKSMGIKVKHHALPFLKLLPDATMKVYKDSFRDAAEFFRNLIEEHITSRVGENPRDYVDMWLEQLEKEAGTGRRFTKTKLLAVLMDLFGAGFETTASSLQWTLLTMLHHPDVQAKIHQELDQSVGEKRQITLLDLDSLPYTQAALWEAVRMFPVLPFAGTHYATQDAMLGGHKIPINTRVTLHLFSILHDPELWEEPEEYRPDRFLQDGKLTMPEYFVPFSAGRRSCIGEQLARKELFLFFANMMQTFKFKTDPKGLPSVKMNDGLVMHADPFQLIAEER